MTTQYDRPRDTLEQLTDRAQVLTGCLNNISSLTVSLGDDGHYHVHPNVSPRIKDPVRRHDFQHKALLEIAKIATSEEIETTIQQHGSNLASNLSLNFAKADDLDRLLTVAYDRLSAPEARINSDTSDKARA